MLREMSTRYGRTPGGYIWGIVEPFAAILFLSVAFSLLLRSPSLGTSFLLFYTTGFLPMNLYTVLSNSVSKSLQFSKPLLRFPAVTWIDAVLARLLLNSLTGVLVAILLFTVILNIVDTRTVLDLGPIIEAFWLTILLGAGVGAINCTLIGLYPAWDVVWSIVSRPLFLASGVIYIYEDLPTFAKEILWYNPLIHITGLARTGFYPTYSPTYISHAYVVFFSMILVALGLLLTKRYHREILNR
ncbi:MAG: ABC transporter permease [Roseovarius sp.]